MAGLIVFCDEDDYWIYDDYLAETVRLFDQDPELHFVFAAQEVRHAGKVINPTRTVALPDSLSLYR